MLLVGGTLIWPEEDPDDAFDDFAGLNQALIFDPATETWTDLPRPDGSQMARHRRSREMPAVLRGGSRPMPLRPSPAPNSAVARILATLATLGAASTLDVPLLSERPDPKRVGVLVVTLLLVRHTGSLRPRADLAVWRAILRDVLPYALAAAGCSDDPTAPGTPAIAKVASSMSQKVQGR
mgnify:CR=1 FL=1